MLTYSNPSCSTSTRLKIERQMAPAFLQTIMELLALEKQSDGISTNVLLAPMTAISRPPDLGANAIRALYAPTKNKVNAAMTMVGHAYINR
jgi:hypothetical protein